MSAGRAASSDSLQSEPLLASDAKAGVDAGAGAAGADPGVRIEPAGADSYEAASARLDEIVRRLDSGEAGLRETLELCREGRRLVEYCARELDEVGRGLEELRLDDLVARLEGGRPSA